LFLLRKFFCVHNLNLLERHAETGFLVGECLSASRSLAGVFEGAFEALKGPGLQGVCPITHGTTEFPITGTSAGYDKFGQPVGGAAKTKLFSNEFGGLNAGKIDGSHHVSPFLKVAGDALR
jgi:hypothetical protein